MKNKFTLVAFNCHQIDLEARGAPSELASVLSKTAEHRVDIYLGCYLFDTKKGWTDMTQLCQHLVNSKEPFVRLPFEEEIHVHANDTVCKALVFAGVDLLPSQPIP